MLRTRAEPSVGGLFGGLLQLRAAVAREQSKQPLPIRRAHQLIGKGFILPQLFHLFL